MNWRSRAVVATVLLQAAVTLLLLAPVVRRRRHDASVDEVEERIAVDALPENLVVWHWDVASHEFCVSERFRKILGLQPTIALTKEALLPHIHPEDRASFEDVFADREGVFDFAFRVLTTTNDLRWIVGRAHAWRDARGVPVRANGVMIDVTERRRSEIEIEQHRQHLAHLARVAILGELSNALAHELNQPLSSILSNAEAAQNFLAQNPVDLNEVRAIVADIANEDRRAAEVIRRLRDMLRRGNSHMQQLDVSQVAHEVIALVRSALIEKHVAVNVRFERMLPSVSGDRVQLQQVLLNLLLNAIDAMSDVPVGDRRIDLVVAKEDGLVHLRVIDRGSGIPAEQLDGVFEPFYTTKDQGLGLGLSICRSIVTAHGGRLWATNNEGVGACFHLRLPTLVPAQLPTHLDPTHRETHERWT